MLLHTGAQELSRALLGATLAALGGPAVSTAQMEHMHDADTAAATVPILFGAFGTPRVDVLAGATVRWMNNSVRVHTVTSDDGAWASGRLPGDDTFTHRFDTVGTATYYCMLHPFMRGEVDVHNVLLAAPTEPGASATAGLAPRPLACRQRPMSSAETYNCGTGHSGGRGAPSGSASAAFLSMKRGRAFSPQRHLLSSPNRASPTNPTRSGIPASAGAIADFQVRGRMSAVP